MKYLIVAAHPDDEVLGAGGAIYKWTREGHIVDVCLMCTEARARAFRPEDKELNNNLNASSKFLGINKIYEGVFPMDNKKNLIAKLLKPLIGFLVLMLAFEIILF